MPTLNPTVSEWFQTEYVTGVEHAFQQKGHTFGKFCRRKVIEGATEAEFHFFGTVTAGKKVGGNIPRQKGAHSKIKIGVEKNFAMIEIDQFDLDQMAEDDRDAAKEAAGMALGRKADSIFLTAMALTAQAVVGGGAGNFMGPGMSQEINRRFTDQHVTGGAAICVISSMMWSHLMRFKEFANSQYTGPALPWMNEDGTAVQAKTWDGKHWIVYPDLIKTGNIRRGYAWVPRAVGEVQLKDLFVNWSWENGEDVWLGNHNFSQGNKILMDTGIVPFGVDETVLPEDIDPETWALAA